MRSRPWDREAALVHADWLQAQGDARGELIAVQDVAETCTSLAELERAQARAIELVELHPSLCPTAPGFDGAGPRQAWASWQRGYVRELELLIDRLSIELEPAARSGPAGWQRSIDALLDHPACALLERVFLRFDLRGEPVNEPELALELAWHLFRARRHGQPQLDLWTHRAPQDARVRLRDALPELAPMWFSSDITRVPPPAHAAINTVVDALAQLSSQHAIDLLWFDDRGHSLVLLDASPSELGWGHGTTQGSVQGRRLAEALRGPWSTRHGPVPLRLLVRLSEAFASYLQPDLAGRPALAPSRAWTSLPKPTDLDRAVAWLSFGVHGPAKASLGAALHELARSAWQQAREVGEDEAMQWFVADGVYARSRPWRGIFALSATQVLLLGVAT